MNRIRTLLLLAALMHCASAHATTSTINPAAPAQGSALSSAVLRQNFQAAYNDITTLFALVGNSLTLAANQITGSLTGGSPVGLNMPSCSSAGQALQWTSGSGFQCASTVPSGTAGGDLAGTFPNPSLANTPTARTNLGLGTAATANTGTSGSAVGLLNSSLTFSGANIHTGVNKFNLNATALPAAQTGTVLQVGNADATISRVENDSYAAGAIFSGMRTDGTNALPTALLSTEEISSFNAWGYNSSAMVGPKGSYSITASEAWSPTANGTQLDFKVTPNGSTSMATAWTMGNDGSLTAAGVTGGAQGVGTLNMKGCFVNGVACSVGSGGGTVNSGTTPELAYYASSTSAVSTATKLQYNSTTKGLGINGVNAVSLPNAGLDLNGVAVGPGALPAYLTTTSNSTAVGYNALNLSTSGTGNTAIGASALAKVVGESNLTAIGAGALANFALGTTSTTSGNTAIGYNALNVETTGTGNTAIGYKALSSHNGGNGNLTAIGYNAMGGTTSAVGAGNTAIGAQAGASLGLLAANDVVIGYTAGSGLVNALQAVCIGAFTKCGTSGSIQDDISIGYQAGNGGSTNIAIGSNSLNSVTGINNVAIGGLTGVTTLQTGNGNILIGNAANVALSDSTDAVIIGRVAKGGTTDTAVGTGALASTATNNMNTVAVGYQSLNSLTSGNFNTAVGYQSGRAGTAITTGTQNTFIGYQAQSTSATAINRTALGYQAISTADNDVVLGNSSVASIHAQVTSITGISDRRHKEDIKPMDLGLAFILDLKPVSYRLKTSNYMEHFGFIAQDTELALTNPYRSIVGKRNPKNALALLQIEDNKEGTYQMNYGELMAPMVKAIQEQQKEIAELKTLLKAVKH